MRYERLTFLLDGKIYYEGYHNLLVSRLYDLEDKIESGELVNVCDYIHEERANKDRKIEELEKENAALRERLKKAVELPDPSILPNFYGCVLTWYTVEEHKKLYDSEKEAEARLAELKEKVNDAGKVHRGLTQ